jgi:hypothetical protein
MRLRRDRAAARSRARAGDAVRDRLPVAIDEADVERHVDARARHDLSLEGIAVDVDDAGEQHEAAGVERAAIGVIGPDVGNHPVAHTDVNRRIGQPLVKQGLRTDDLKLHRSPHATADACRRPGAPS